MMLWMEKLTGQRQGEELSTTSLLSRRRYVNYLKKRAWQEKRRDHKSPPERFFIITADKSDIDRSGWSNNEKEVIREHYWWSLEELRQTNEIIFPLDLIINILEGSPCT